MRLPDPMPEYDAFVLIHPDALPLEALPNKRFEGNIRSILEKGGPAFLLPWNMTLRDPFSAYLEEEMTIIPGGRMLTADNAPLDEQTRFLAGKLGSHPEDVRLLFGGVYAAGCVSDYLQAWCSLPIADYPFARYTRRASPLLGLGISLDALTDGAASIRPERFPPEHHPWRR